MTKLLEIRDLSVAMLRESGGDLRILDQVSLAVAQGETLGLVGESGCGKSTLAKAILRCLAAPAYIQSGSIGFQGRDLLSLSTEELRQVRWSGIAMVVQSALDALNPVLSLEAQFLDTMRAKGPIGRASARERAAECLSLAGLDRSHLGSYPHELSGGMRQRAVIALALVFRPQLLIMDEPTTALDVITQAEILARIRELQDSQHFAVLLITHDLPLAVDFCDRIAVMYAGKVVEDAPAYELDAQPYHPYTAGLIHSFPRPGRKQQSVRSIPGQPVSFGKLPQGCAFHPRCAQAAAQCRQSVPALRPSAERQVRCFQPLSP